MRYLGSLSPSTLPLILCGSLSGPKMHDAQFMSSFMVLVLGGGEINRIVSLSDKSIFCFSISPVSGYKVANVVEHTLFVNRGMATFISVQIK